MRKYKYYVHGPKYACADRPCTLTLAIQIWTLLGRVGDDLLQKKKRVVHRVHPSLPDPTRIIARPPNAQEPALPIPHFMGLSLYLP